MTVQLRTLVGIIMVGDGDLLPGWLLLLGVYDILLRSKSVGIDYATTKDFLIRLQQQE